MKEFLHQLFFLMGKDAGKRLTVMFVLMTLSSLLDMVGIGFVGVFLMMLTNPNLLLAHVPFLHNLSSISLAHSWLVSVGLVIIGSFILRAIAGCYLQKKIVCFSINSGLTLRLRLMQAYQKAPYAYHLKHNSAHLINQINQAGSFTGLLTTSLMLIANSMMTSAIIALLLIKFPIPTFMLAVIFSALIWLNNKLLKQAITHHGKTLAVIGGHLIKNIYHGILGLQEIRILGKENYFFNQVQCVVHTQSDIDAKMSMYQQIPRYIIESTVSVFIITLCIFCVLSGMESDKIFSFIGVFVTAGVRLMPTMNQLTSGITQIRSCTPMTSTMYCTLHELQQISPGSLLSSSEKIPFSNVSLNHVRFRYPEATCDALFDVTLHIQKGQSIALVGTSGAGKSTLVNVILGMFPPQEGALLVNGQPISNMRAWLNNVAYIPQNIFLLDDTLKNNIALGIEEASIDHAKLTHAIKMAQLEQVVVDLPQGIETILGANGIKLSGGQRQRVALARTFYHERDIIIMDEATSALDHETEQDVIRSIKQLHGIKTLIIIAHRLTTVEHCDVICKMEKGRIIQVGSFKDVVGSVLPKSPFNPKTSPCVA